jgi:uncharacterized protein YlaN (UPF0358 family)
MAIEDARLREAALDLVREEYENAARLNTVSLEKINRVRPPWKPYASIDQLVDEWLAMAGAVSTFAVRLGLISPEEAGQIIRDFFAAHPELIDEEWEAWARSR